MTSEIEGWITTMYGEGFEFANHGYNHTTTQESVDSMKLLYDDLGIYNVGYCGPGGSGTPVWSQEQVDIVKQYHHYYMGRDSADGVEKPYDMYRLPRWFITGSTTEAQIDDHLGDCATNNTWLIFASHGIDSVESQVEYIFARAAALGIDVKTVEEVVEENHPLGTTIDCSSDVNQDQTLTYSTETDAETLDPEAWNEYWHETTWTGPRYVGSPVVYCHTSEDNLPVMRFSKLVPNGTYQVKADLVTLDPGDTYTVYYSFDEGNPSQFSVNMSENSEVVLESVTVTDGMFNLYTQNAESDGADDYVGWAFVKLFRTDAQQ
jgi:hypothetical protein